MPVPIILFRIRELFVEVIRKRLCISAVGEMNITWQKPHLNDGAPPPAPEQLATHAVLHPRSEIFQNVHPSLSGDLRAVGWRCFGRQASRQKSGRQQVDFV